MKAIETEYKGVLFRSRLEARWAIFFDALNLEWVYEPDCFELKNGQKYTPDFYLPKYDLFIEVKPNFEWVENEYHKKRYQLFEKKLLVLSVPYPSLSVAFQAYNIGYCDPIYFCPNSKYEPFFYVSCELGDSDDYFKDDYKEEIEVVKKHRFYK